MKISCKRTGTGFKLGINGKNYALDYPDNLWADLPNQTKGFFEDNMAYLMTAHLPLMFGNGTNALHYASTSAPFFQPMFDETLMYHIPSTAAIDGKDTSELLRRFINTQVTFSDYNVKIPSEHAAKADYNDGAAAINFTFGKDSLLTFAVCSELGLDTTLAYIEEPNAPVEIAHNRALEKKFSKEFNTSLTRIANGTSILHDHKYWGIDKTEWGYGHLITEYCLEMLPLLYQTRSGNVMFGNEQSCNYTYENQDGFISYPVYDQTKFWTQKMDAMMRATTGGGVGVCSIVEPLHDLAIIKILHTRYKDFGKYQLSCFPDEHDTNSRWCHNCSKCARIYLYLKACGFDVRRAGMLRGKNMFGKEYKPFYKALFGGTLSGDETMLGYDASGVARDEQLLAFYLAHENGSSGFLIDEFRKKYLGEARLREDELRKRFFALHDPITVPKDLKKQVLSIYKEELED